MDRKEIARKFAEEVAAKYPNSVKSILLYGSVARGDDKEGSDIDLVVLTRGKPPERMERYMGEMSFDYSMRYRELPMAFAYEEKDFMSKAGRFFFPTEVLKEGVVLYGR